MKSPGFGFLLLTGCVLTASGTAQFQSCGPAVALEVVGNHAVGDDPWSLATCDLNGDGRVDLAVPNSDSDDVTILLGVGDGTFLPASPVPVGGGPFWVAVADLDGDGHEDLATANIGSDDVSVALGLGGAVFGPAQHFPVGVDPTAVVIADLDSDGVVDLAVAEPSEVRVMIGVGDGTFLAGQTYPAGFPWTIYAADLDDDGSDDLILGNTFFVETVTVLMNKGDGTFDDVASYSTGICEPWYLTIADYNADGIEDIGAASRFPDCVGLQQGGSGRVSTLLGLGDGTFDAARETIIGGFPWGVGSADFDKDGWVDFVLTNTFSDDSVTIVRGLGNGFFAGPTDFTFGKEPEFLAVGDFDGDSIDDVVTVNRGSNDVTALVNFSVVQAPTTYCTAKVNTQGCVPAIDGTGNAGFSDPGPFAINAVNVLNQKPAIFFYGLNGRAAAPFLGGTLCVLPPVRRSPVLLSAGNPPPDDCSGSYSFDFNAWTQTGQDPALMVGDRVNGQYWTRDPAQPDGTGAGLTDAIEFELCP